MEPALDKLPGFRRRLRITPDRERVCCEVEDDYHCMAVTVYHDGVRATRIEPLMRRAPWTTCAGAIDVLKSTFTDVPLVEFAERGDRKSNCTHLHDLARLAAAHAADDASSVYDILVSDPVEGERRSELRANGRTVLAWTEVGSEIIEPAELAGVSLWDLQPWIATLDTGTAEAARLLRWGAMLANGRIIPLEQQSDASRMPPNCYTFQPEQAAYARRVGEVRDFSAGDVAPLENYEAFA